MTRLVSYMGICAVWIFVGGCVDSSSPPPETVSHVGGWNGTKLGCEERLVLEESGRFSLSARIHLAGSTRLEEISGQYTQEGGPDSPRLNFNPDEALNPRAILYCDQWLNRGELELGFSAISSQTGISPLGLNYRTEISPSLGRVTVGTDNAQADRYASYQGENGGVVQIVLTDPEPVAHPLYRTDFGDANHELSTISGLTVVNMPYRAWQGSFASATAGGALARLVLNLASASEVIFSPSSGSGLPPCDYSIYADPTFGTLESSFVFSANQTIHAVQFNPGDPGAFFYRSTVNVGGNSAVAYLIPLSITAPASGGCAIRIRGRSMILPVLEAFKSQNNPALVNIPASAPDPFGAWFPAYSPSTLLLGPRPPGVVLAESRTHSAIVFWMPLSVGADGTAPLHDQFDLLGINNEAIAVSVERSDQEAYLSLFPAGGAANAFGPLRAIGVHAGTLTLANPSTNSLQLESNQQVRYFRFSLASPGRLAIWTEGGLALVGELYTVLGRDLARNQGGAPDGAGFQIVRQLAADTYEIAVRRLGGSGAFTLRIDSPISFPFSDDALGECLLEAKWATGATISSLNCSGRGISSLAGIESMTGLQRLSLARNKLTDIGGLQNLTGLREITLDDNQLSDLSALAGLPFVERLGLGGNPLNAAAVSVLGGLSTLTHLDLRDVPTLTEAAATSLKQSLINTLIVTPDGTILE